MCLEVVPQDKSIFIPLWLVSWSFSVIFARDSSVSTGCTVTSVQMWYFSLSAKRATEAIISVSMNWDFLQSRVTLLHSECSCHYIVFTWTASVRKSFLLFFFHRPLLFSLIRNVNQNLFTSIICEEKIIESRYFHHVTQFHCWSHINE